MGNTCRSPRRVRSAVLGLALAAAAALPVLCAGDEPVEFSGKVVAVTDGDTLSVRRDGKTVKIRLEGIDAPEHGQGYFKIAREGLVYGSWPLRAPAS